MSFFMSIKSLFKDGADGRYIGHLLKAIGEVNPAVLYPFIGRRIRAGLVRVDTEHTYAKLNGQSRRADLFLDIQIGPNASRQILIEIKINDNLLPGQLAAYDAWAAKEDGRKVFLLTAHPIIAKDKETLSTVDSARVIHIYFSDYVAAVKRFLHKSTDSNELVNLLIEYFLEEGYCMHNFLEDESGLQALKSFMVLNFLRHESGHGKQAKAAKIADGPAAFGRLIQNWQLVASLVADKLGCTRIPTTRYTPQQGNPGRITTKDPKEDQIHLEKKWVRPDREWGRFWIWSTIVAGDRGINQIQFEWGLIVQIELGIKTESTAESGIKCATYALARQARNKIGRTQMKWHHLGIKSKEFYDPAKFSSLLIEQINAVKSDLPTEILAQLKSGGSDSTPEMAGTEEEFVDED